MLRLHKHFIYGTQCPNACGGCLELSQCDFRISSGDCEKHQTVDRQFTLRTNASDTADLYIAIPRHNVKSTQVTLERIILRAGLHGRQRKKKSCLLEVPKRTQSKRVRRVFVQQNWGRKWLTDREATTIKSFVVKETKDDYRHEVATQVKMDGLKLNVAHNQYFVSPWKNVDCYQKVMLVLLGECILFAELYAPVAEQPYARRLHNRVQKMISWQLQANLFYGRLEKWLSRLEKPQTERKWTMDIANYF